MTGSQQEMTLNEDALSNLAKFSHIGIDVGLQ